MNDMSRGRRHRQKPSKKKMRWWQRILFLLLLLISLALIFNSSIRNMIIAWRSNQYQVENVSKEKIEKNKKKKANFNFKQVQSISTEAIIKAQWEAQQLPVIGGIAIPDLKINLPIFNGLDNTGLMYGAGTMKETQKMGEANYTLASHHTFAIAGASDILFSPLDNAKEGMKIYLTDKEKIYVYSITSVETVQPDRLDVIEDKEGVKEITLVTCEDLDATKRIIVKGVFEEAVAYDQAPESMRNPFRKSYNQFQA